MSSFDVVFEQLLVLLHFIHDVLIDIFDIVLDIVSDVVLDVVLGDFIDAVFDLVLDIIVDEFWIFLMIMGYINNNINSMSFMFGGVGKVLGWWVVVV